MQQPHSSQLSLVELLPGPERRPMPGPLHRVCCCGVAVGAARPRDRPTRRPSEPASALTFARACRACTTGAHAHKSYKIRARMAQP